MMEDKHVKQWLTDFKSLNNSDTNAFSKKICSDAQLISSICNTLDKGNIEHLAPVYSQLFELYKTGMLELQRFTLQFLPVIFLRYLQTSILRKECGQYEGLMLGIFNLHALEVDGTSKTDTVRIPSLGKPSIYHEPSIQLAISDNLPLHQENIHRTITRAPLPEVDAIQSCNRFLVINELTRLYNADIGDFHPVSLEFFCRSCTQICQSGFSGKSKGHHNTVNIDLNLDFTAAGPRIPLNSEFMTELLHGLYYTIFNGCSALGIEALEAISSRSEYEMYPDVLLVTKAIKHSLDTNPSGRPHDGPVGVNIALTPASPIVRKGAITGASFKSSKTKEITITVTIESISTSSNNNPPKDGTDGHHPKQTDTMHRLAVANNQRKKNQGKGHGNGNAVESKVGASNNLELKKTSGIRSSTGKDKVRKNGSDHGSTEADLNQENTKQKMKGHLELNLSSIDTAF